MGKINLNFWDNLLDRSRIMSGMFGWIEYNKKKINDDFPGLSSQQFFTKCMSMWKELDDSERVEWKATPKRSSMVEAEVEAEVEEEEEEICVECGECPGTYKCVECGESYCNDDGEHNGCWRFQRIVWSEGKSKDEISEIERKYPDGVCKKCVES